ncbi:MAG TPA: DUF2339 domain-containing protein [Ohtaekwangia sp.]
MEFLILVLIIIVLVVILSLKNDVSNRIKSLELRMELLLAELKKTRSQAPVQEKPKETPSILQDIVTEHKTPVIKPEPVKEIEKPEVKEPVKTPEVVSFPKSITPPPVTIKPPVVQPPQPRKPGFFERNPDLEKFIGENLANKIGIGVLVLGIGFFVKYAIDQEWINEIGRVFIGILCGGILLGIAHKLRQKFAAFSSVLVGGGIAVLYLTIAIAFHEYHIFTQTAAFILMLIITGFAVVLSLSYNRIELAILSILGGFASPFMVSTGEGNYVVLFTYILILDSGILVLAYFKKWNLVTIIAYAFTLLLFGSWLGVQFDGEQSSMVTGAMIFASLFYGVFFAMSIINNLKERTTFKAIEITLLLSNTFFFYGAGMYILDNPSGENLKGLFTASLGIINFIFAYLLYRKSHVDKKLVFLLIGLVLTFISLAAPVQLEGNYITLFWSAEAVLLLWLSQKSGIRLMKLTSVVVTVLMVISLLMDWNNIYFSLDSEFEYMTIILNKGYITGIFSLLSLTLTWILLRKETSEYPELVDRYKFIILIAGIAVLYISQVLELRHQLYHYGFEYETQNIIIGCYNMLFLLGAQLVGRKQESIVLKGVLAAAGVIGMAAYLVYYQQQIVISRNDFLLNDGTITGFIFHYILIGLLIAVAYFSLKKVQGLDEFNRETFQAYSWFYVFFFVFMASAELDHTVLLIAQPGIETIDHVLTQNHKIGYPILWGLTSFLLIFIGLKMKKKHLRIISLTLFLITLIKLFTVDIRGISEGGKIAAFISLGVLLLVVSFMYQRLKKLLLADEPVQTHSENKDNS